MGHTSQWLKSRLSLHRSYVRNKNHRCTLAAHALKSDHNIEYENVEILDKNKYQQKKNSRNDLYE